jgi:hypothetical protein
VPPPRSVTLASLSDVIADRAARWAHEWMAHLIMTSGYVAEPPPRIMTNALPPRGDVLSFMFDWHVGNGMVIGKSFQVTAMALRAASANGDPEQVGSLIQCVVRDAIESVWLDAQVEPWWPAWEREHQPQRQWSSSVFSEPARQEIDIECSSYGSAFAVTGAALAEGQRSQVPLTAELLARTRRRMEEAAARIEIIADAAVPEGMAFFIPSGARNLTGSLWGGIRRTMGMDPGVVDGDRTVVPDSRRHDQEWANQYQQRAAPPPQREDPYQRRMREYSQLLATAPGPLVPSGGALARELELAADVRQDDQVDALRYAMDGLPTWRDRRTPEGMAAQDRTAAAVAGESNQLTPAGLRELERHPAPAAPPSVRMRRAEDEIYRRFGNRIPTHGPGAAEVRRLRQLARDQDAAEAAGRGAAPAPIPIHTSDPVEARRDVLDFRPPVADQPIIPADVAERVAGLDMDPFPRHPAPADEPDVRLTLLELD